MPQVTISDRANIGRLDTPYGVIRKRVPISVPVNWALMRIKDPNLMFVFEESDRKDVLETDKKTLNILSRVMGEELADASSLSSLLLPAKKKTISKPKISKPKKESKVEEVVEE